MDFKAIKKYFYFSKNQKTGLIVLFTIIIIQQLIYSFANFESDLQEDIEAKKWLSVQSEIDSMKADKQINNPKKYPFNPNFITDYKGYRLGMSIEEIDRLHSFRNQDKFVNSVQEFQQVTKVSDSLLKAISPYFTFPNWDNHYKAYSQAKPSKEYNTNKKEKIVYIDINNATKDDLIKVYGIGEVSSQRILNQRERLGSFVSMEQIDEISGISPEAIQNIHKYFKILTPPLVKKININTASIKELTQLLYFRYSLARQIVIHRSMNGDIQNIDDLIKIKGFPIEKANIISLYLDF